jgi:hypothetical protein
MTESEIQKQIIDYAIVKGCEVFRMNAGKSGRYNTRLCPPGTPDLLIVGHVGCTWVEVKAKDGKLRATQDKMHKILRGFRQQVIVAYCLEDVIGYI